MVELEVKKWGTETGPNRTKKNVLTKGCDITHIVDKNNIFEVCQFGILSIGGHHVLLGETSGCRPISELMTLLTLIGPICHLTTHRHATQMTNIR